MTANLSGAPFVAGRGLSGAQGIAYLNQLVAMVNESPGGLAGSGVEINGGTIIPTRAYHTVDTEGQAASDNLDNAATTNMPTGRWLLLRGLTGARAVTVRSAKGGSGQFLLGRGDFVLNASDKFLLLANTGDSWAEIARTYGADVAAELDSLGLGDIPLLTAFESAELPFNSRTYTFVAHGLGGVPKLAQLIVRCKTAENGWAVGDEAIPLSSAADGNPAGFDIGWGASNIWFKTVNTAQPLLLGRKNDADGQLRMTNANWKVVLRAWR